MIGLQGKASLIFQTLPIAFAQLPGGYWVALAFFVLLSFAALTSAISLLEVATSYFIDELGWSALPGERVDAFLEYIEEHEGE